MNRIIYAYNKGYRCTRSGNMINPKGNKIGFVASSGYVGTNIRINKKSFHICAHRLQAFQKYGDDMFKEGIQVRHLNANKVDFSWKNIAIGTQSDNMMDVPYHIRIARSLHAGSVVRKYDKEKVTKFYNACRSYKKTKKKFNISSSGTLNYILNGPKKKTLK